MHREPEIPALSSESPSVSVVIPTYNRLSLLREAIGSVAAQTRPPRELIIVDDGSTDGTPDALGRAAGDVPVRVVPLRHTGCIGRVRNEGVRAASGNWIAFLDSDDLWLPRKLEMQAEMLRRSRARWCYTGFELMDSDRRAVPLHGGTSRPLSGRIVRELLTTETGVAVSSLVVERRLLEEAGGFSDSLELLYREDYDLVLRLALRADAAAVPDPLVRVREHSGRSTAGWDDAHERSARAYDRFMGLNPPADLRRLARRMRSEHLAQAGARRLSRGEFAKSGLLLARALAGGVPGRTWLRAVVGGVRRRFQGGAEE